MLADETPEDEGEIVLVAGVRPAFYRGDDAQNEYVYKFVSNAVWAAADATATDRLAIGETRLAESDKILKQAETELADVLAVRVLVSWRLALFTQGLDSLLAGAPTP